MPTPVTIWALRRLLAASEQAAEVLCDQLNAEYFAGNHEFEDVQQMDEELDGLNSAIKFAEFVLEQHEDGS